MHTCKCNLGRIRQGEVEMSNGLAAPARNLLVASKERRQAHKLLEVLGDQPERFTLEDREQHLVPLPAELARILATVVEVVAKGGTVTIGSLPEELTTTVAAEQLGVSRPTLMKMIRNKQIPAHKVGSHHRVKLSDVLAMKRARLEKQRRAFDELRELSELLDAEDSEN